MSAEEYLLKTDNYAFAAKSAPAERQRAMIRAAAICRNRALRLTLAARNQAHTLHALAPMIGPF